MNVRVFVLPAILSLAVAACGSSGGGTGGAGGTDGTGGSAAGGPAAGGSAAAPHVACDTVDGSIHSCIDLGVLSPEGKAAVAQTCMSHGGKLASSCPTEDLAGFCTFAADNVQYSYFPSANVDNLEAWCVESGGTWTPAQLACTPEGKTCNVDEVCCSFACINGACSAPMGGCAEINAPCTSESQCCSGTCGGLGKCILPPGSCALDGTVCTKDQECCGMVCLFFDFDAGRCQGASCMADYTSCSSHDECCSGFCNSDIGACEPYPY